LLDGALPAVMQQLNNTLFAKETPKPAA